MEMGIPGHSSRFDMVAALPSEKGSRLTFFEVKHSENSDLRSNEDGKQKVLKQLEKYETDLRDLKEQLLAGYVNAVNTAKSIETRGGCLQALATLVPESMLEVDIKPRLVVFPGPSCRPLEDPWRSKLLKNNVRLIYANDAKDISLTD